MISPLLANIYLNEMDTLWSKKVDVSDARMIRYADDIAILAKNKPEKYMDHTKRILDLLKLELNMDKSRITDVAEGFDFLGIHYQRRYCQRQSNFFQKRQLNIFHPYLDFLSFPFHLIHADISGPFAFFQPV